MEQRAAQSMRVEMHVTLICSRSVGWACLCALSVCVCVCEIRGNYYKPRQVCNSVSVCAVDTGWAGRRDTDNNERSDLC